LVDGHPKACLPAFDVRNARRHLQPDATFITWSKRHSFLKPGHSAWVNWRAMMSKKYELLKEDTVTTLDGRRTLYRIRALRDGPGPFSTGILGGYIESEANLSHFGECWVSDSAWIYQDARIYDNAWVCGHAKVYGDARISGCACVGGSAQVSGRAGITDHAKVRGQAKVSGFAFVCGSALVYGNARLNGFEQIYG